MALVLLILGVGLMGFGTVGHRPADAVSQDALWISGMMSFVGGVVVAAIREAHPPKP